jgi:hypothetical protein
MSAVEAYLTIREYELKTPIELDTLLHEIMYRSGCRAEVSRKEKPYRTYTLGDHIVVEHYKRFAIEIDCEGVKEYIRLSDVIIVYDKITDAEFIVRFKR